MKKMLLVFAHPDDESFSCGGVIAKYKEAGWQIDVVSATRGEAGDVGSYAVCSGEKLGEIRQKELEKAGTILGIHSVTFLGYKDGTLQNLLAGELEDKIYEQIIKEIPDIIITFDTTGISNHPDHVKICYATTFAFQKYASWIKDQTAGRQDYGDEYDPKLYYACMPRSVANHLIEKKIIPSEMFGKSWRGTADKMITTVINIQEYQSLKTEALRAHVSQLTDVNRFLSYDKNPLLQNEYFILRMHGAKEIFMGKFDSVAIEL